MGRFIYSPKAAGASLSGPIPVELGGTGAKTKQAAVSNLGGISSTLLDVPSGILGLDTNSKVRQARLKLGGANGLAVKDATGKLPASMFANASLVTVTVSGPTQLYNGQVGTFVITNFDMTTTYVVTATTGTVSRSGNTITYTAPSTTGVAGFTVNGRSIPVTTVFQGVNKASLTSPVTGTNVVSGSLVLNAAAFSYTGTGDTLQSTSWQIANDANFTSVAVQNIDSVSSLTTWTATGLTAGRTYYIRVRQKGNTYGYGAWSDTVVITTTDITMSGSSAVYVSTASNFTISNYDSGIVYTVTALAGTVSRSGNVVTYTTPSTSGVSGFVINGKTTAVTVLAAAVITPAVTSPVNGSSNIANPLTANSGAFAVGGGTDTHLNSSWQVATDVNFTNVVSSLNDSTVSKLSWTPTSLLSFTTYYIRVRHKGTSLGYSQWSAANSFTTNGSF